MPQVTTQSERPSRATWVGATVLLASVYYALLALVLCPPSAFWSGDAGLKLLQIEGVFTSGGQSLALPYPGRQWDPEQEHFPISSPFAVRRGEGWYSTFPPFFPLLTLPFYWVFGDAGLYVWPVAGGVATVILSQQLARRMGLSRGAQAAAAALVAFGSPLALYSATFWEHTPALALSMAALVMLTGRFATEGRESRVESLESSTVPNREGRVHRWLYTRPSTLDSRLIAGLCIGLAWAFRYESAVFLVIVVVVGVASGIWRGHGMQTAAVVVVAALVPMAIVCGLNVIWFGHPLGLFPEHFAASEGSASRWLIVKRMLLWDQESQGFQSALLPLFPVCALGVLILLPQRLLRTGAGSSSHDRHDRAVVRFVVLTCMAYVIVMLAKAPNWGGAQFAPRYLLPAIPGLLVAAVAAATTPSGAKGLILRFAVVLLGVYGVFRGAEGSYRLWDVKNHLEGEMLRVIERSSADAILIGRHEFFAQQAASQFRAQPMFRLTGTGADRQLLSRLPKSYHRFLYVDLFDLEEMPGSMMQPSVRRDFQPVPIETPQRLEDRHYHFELWLPDGASESSCTVPTNVPPLR